MHHQTNPRRRRRSRRGTARSAPQRRQTVDTILEESEESKEEEEKTEFEPPEFFDVVGSHVFIPRRRQSSFERTLPMANLNSSSETSSSRQQRNLHLPIQQPQHSQQFTPSTLSASPNTRVENRIIPEYEEEIQESSQETTIPSWRMGWIQFRALLYKNYLVELPTLVLDLFIPLVVVGFVLVLLHHISKVPPSSSNSTRPLWNLHIPLNVTSEEQHFWVRAITGRDELNVQTLRQVVSEWFGQPVADYVLGPSSNELVRVPLNAEQWEKMALTASRLMRRPIPIPTLELFIMIAKQVVTSLGTLHVAGGTDEFVHYLQAASSFQLSKDNDPTKVRLRLHNTSDDALAYIVNHTTVENVWALLDMTHYHDPDQPRYKIRMNPMSIPSTAYMYGRGDNEYQYYYMSGYLSLQRTVNTYAFRVADQTAETGCYRQALREVVLSVPMPIPEGGGRNPFWGTHGFLLGFTCLAALWVPLSRFTKAMVEEKETQQWHLFHLAGVRLWAHFGAWYCFGLALLGGVGVLIAVVLSVYIFSHVPLAAIVVWMLLLAAVSVSFSFVVTAFFQQARLAVIAGPLVLFMTALPRYLLFGIRGGDYPARHKLLASLFPATAFVFAADCIVEYEDAFFVESNNNNSNNSKSLWEGEFSLKSALTMMFIDAVLYGIIGWLLFYVFQYRSYHTLSLFQKTCWPVRSSPVDSLSAQSSSLDDEEEDDDEMSTTSHVDEEEDEDGSLSARCISSRDDDSGTSTVRMEQLNHQSVPFRKSYEVAKLRSVSFSYGCNKSIPLAVSKINFSFYKGQVTAILGHNGAGKSTLLQLLTGSLRPTNGECTVGGLPLFENDTRDFPIGLCPQQDVLYDNLTVTQHLSLYLSIKTGIVPSKRDLKILATQTGIGDSLFAKAGSLSQGNKRKLSLALASCGRQKLLLLDEPTSAMDLVSRRACWKFLKRKSKDRAVVVVTHNTQEAEACADRVVLMRHGIFQASGSCSFLEKRFSLGYKVSIIGRGSSTIGSGSWDGDRYLRLVLLHCPKARLVRTVGRRVFIFQVPAEEESTLPNLLKTLDKEELAGDLEAFGVESFCLMEVFHILAEDCDDLSADSPTDGSFFGGDPPEEQSPSSSSLKRRKTRPWGFQVGLMLWKRWLVQKRDIWSLAISILFIVSLIAMSLTILTVKQPDPGPPLDMTLSDPRISGGSSVQVAGGAGFLNKFTMQRDMVDLVQKFNTSLRNIDGGGSLTHLEHITDSDQLHSFLKSSFANSTETSAGFLVFKDMVKLKWAFDRAYVRDASAVVAKNLRTKANNVPIVPNEDPLLSMLPNSQWLSSTLSSIVENLSQSFLESNPSNSGQYHLHTDATVVHNSSSPHAVAFYNNVYQQILFASCGGNLPRLTNHPLPVLDGQQSLERELLLKMTALLFLLIPLCSLPGLFVPHHVKEYTCKAKFLQLSNGVSLSAFWVSNFLWDLFIYALIAGIVFLVFVAFGETTGVFVGDRNSALCTFLLILGYGASALPFSYILSIGFRNPARAQILVIAVILVTGFVSVVVVFVLEKNETTRFIAPMVAWPLRIFPAFNLGDGFVKMCENFLFKEIRQAGHQDVFEYEVAGEALVAMGLCSPFYLAVLLAVDGLSVPFLLSRIAEKFAVLHEIQTRPDAPQIGNRTSKRTSKRTLRRNRVRASISADGLWKVYSPSASVQNRFLQGVWQFFRCFYYALSARDPPIQDNPKTQSRQAVRDLSLSLIEDEILAVVGPNGCGKSTLLGMLSGEIRPTSGGVHVGRKNLHSIFPWEASAARKRVGLCPQVDPVLELMTGREMLIMHCKVAGFRESHVHEEVQSLLRELQLLSHADNIVKTYSGGNRRKLSLGIALASEPAILVIDESTSNLDPASKRKIWDLISRAGRGRTVILSTHSMEEANAISSKTAIMSEGQFSCLGSAAELQKKFFNFYTVDLNLAFDATPDEVQSVVQYITDQTLPGSTLLDHFDRCLTFKWARDGDNAGIGASFGRLVDLRSQVFFGLRAIESFSIRHSSLDQVFRSASKEKKAQSSNNSRECYKEKAHIDECDEVGTYTTEDSSHFSERLFV